MCGEKVSFIKTKLKKIKRKTVPKRRGKVLIFTMLNLLVDLIATPPPPPPGGASDNIWVIR